MRRIHILLAAAALLAGGSALAQTYDTKTKTDTAKPAGADQEFATTIGGAGLAEVELSKMAVTRGTSAIRPIAERMINDHTAANTALAAVAGTKNIALPKEMPADRKQTIDRLSKLQGEEFDRAYLDTLMKSHEKSLQLFTDEIRKGADLDMMAFAANTLPVIIGHYALVHGSTPTGHKMHDTGY